MAFRLWCAFFFIATGIVAGVRLDEEPAVFTTGGPTEEGTAEPEGSEDSDAEAAAQILQDRNEAEGAAAEVASEHVEGTEKLAGEVKSTAMKKAGRASVAHQKAAAEHAKKLDTAVRADLKVERLGIRQNETELYRVKKEAAAKALADKHKMAKLTSELKIEKAATAAQKAETHKAEFNAADQATAVAGVAKLDADKKLEGATEAAERAADREYYAADSAERTSALYNDMAEKADNEKSMYEKAEAEKVEAKKVLDEKVAAEKTALKAAEDAKELVKHTAGKHCAAARTKQDVDEQIEATTNDAEAVGWAAKAVRADADKAEQLHGARHVEHREKGVAEEKAKKEAEGDAEEEGMSDELKGALEMEKIAQSGDDEAQA